MNAEDVEFEHVLPSSLDISAVIANIRGENQTVSNRTF